MNTEEDGSRKVAFVNIPLPESVGTTGKAGCQQCCCTSFKVSLPAINSSTLGAENRQRLLTIIQELEAEFTIERESLRTEYRNEITALQGRLRDAEQRAQSDRTTLQSYLNRPQPTIDESPLKIEIAQLRDKLTSVEKERDALLRNKVTFIEANLAERNMQLENEIECLRLHHKDELTAQDKSWREKEAQWNSAINNIRDDKTRLELQIKNWQGQAAGLRDALKKEEAATAQERQKNEEHIRETTRLKAEVQSHGQMSKSEVQLMRERLDEYKERVSSLEGKLSSQAKEREDLFRLTIEQKSEIDKRERAKEDLKMELKSQQEHFNNKLRDTTADFQGKLRGADEDLKRSHQERANIEKQLTGRLSKLQAEATAAHKKLEEDHLQNLRSLEGQHRQHIQKVEQEWTSKFEELRAEHLRQTMKPPKTETKTEYVYIEKQVQSPELKITTERLLQLTARSLTLQTQIEDLKLENAQLKEKLNFLGGLQATFNKEKQKWRLERDELQKRITDFELKGDNRNRFEWAVERIIDAQGRGQEHFRYRQGGVRVVDTTNPNIVYKVISPEHVYQSLTDRLEEDVRGHSVERVVVEQQARYGN